MNLKYRWSISSRGASLDAGTYVTQFSISCTVGRHDLFCGFEDWTRYRATQTNTSSTRFQGRHYPIVRAAEVKSFNNRSDFRLRESIQFTDCQETRYTLEVYFVNIILSDGSIPSKASTIASVSVSFHVVNIPSADRPCC